MRRRGRSDLHGWVLLDKPLGLGSTSAVGLVRRLFGVKRVGHAGTLDPLATGLLPIAIGEATKLVSLVQEGRKTYRFDVAWGAETASDDAETPPVKTSEKRPKRGEILAILPRFLGEISQIPPIFSALKVEGKRAYDLARGGEMPVLAPRRVEIEALKMEGEGPLEEEQAHTSFEVVCGKGTYIRALARDFGRFLGCFGHVTALRRTQVGLFLEKEMISLEKLKELGHKGTSVSSGLALGLRPLEEAWGKRVRVSEEQARDLVFGKTLDRQGIDGQSVLGEGACLAMLGERPIAIVRLQGEVLRSVRVFNWG